MKKDEIWDSMNIKNLLREKMKKKNNSIPDYFRKEQSEKRLTIQSNNLRGADKENIDEDKFYKRKTEDLLHSSFYYKSILQ